jgi:hypothetical protein
MSYQDYFDEENIYPKNYHQLVLDKSNENKQIKCNQRGKIAFLTILSLTFICILTVLKKNGDFQNISSSFSQLGINGFTDESSELQTPLNYGLNDFFNFNDN